MTHVIFNTIPGFWYWIQTPFGGFVEDQKRNPSSDREDYYQCDCTGSKCELESGLKDGTGSPVSSMGFSPRHR